MFVWQWLLWILGTGIGVWLAYALITEVGRSLGWKFIEDIAQGHPDEFGAMDRRDRGLR